MHQSTELYDGLVAPSPVVPTCRPNPSLSRDRSYNIPSWSSKPRYPTPAEDDQLRQRSETQMMNDDMTELDRFLQTQNVSSVPPQPTGAREILKAGQRRLRQLAQRQWKPTDPKIKAEEASRHLFTLQQEGFLPKPVPKRPGPKKSVDSAISSSRSTSNFSFKSSSRRDVEQIGQPWLNPLEISVTHDPRSGGPSALDLGELTSPVEAVVSPPLLIDDAIPPPYQPPANTNSNPQAEGPESRHLTDTQCQLVPSFKPNDQQAHSPAVPAATIPGQVPKDGKGQIPAVLTPGNGGSGGGTKQTKEQEPNSAVSKKKPGQAAEKPTTSSATPRDPPGMSAQTLKLFPDTMPLRVSNKGAWRIPNNRVLGKDAANPGTTPGVHRQRVPVAMKPKNSLYLSATTLPEHQGEPRESYQSSKSPCSKSGKPCSEPARSPVHPDFPLPDNGRRPASLPTGIIDSFPLPAPKRPLPSLPEPVPALNTARHHSTPTNERITRSNRNHSDVLPTIIASSANKREGSLSHIPQVTLPRSRLDRKDSCAWEQGNSADETISIPTGKQSSFADTDQSRAEKVRALKLRDMMASRVYLKGAETPQGERKIQTAESPVSPKSHGRGLHSTDSNEKQSQGSERNRTDAASSTPPCPPPHPLPPRPPVQCSRGLPYDKRYCSSPTGFLRASSERREPLSLSIPNRFLMYRDNSTRSTGALHELVSSEQNILNRAGSPLPSSDDECRARDTPTCELRQVSGRRPWSRKSHSDLDNVGSGKRCNSKKPAIPGCVGPLTPRRGSSRGPENPSPQSHDSQSSYSSRDPQEKRDTAACVLNSLEGRIAQLEHQNRILQAALFAALDVGVRHSIGGQRSGSTTSLCASASSSGAERSSLSSADRPAGLHSRVERGRHSRMKKSLRRPGNLVDSPGSSLQSKYQTDDSASVRELEDMIEDLEFTWMTDRPSSGRIQT